MVAGDALTRKKTLSLKKITRKIPISQRMILRHVKIVVKGALISFCAIKRCLRRFYKV